MSSRRFYIILIGLLSAVRLNAQETNAISGDFRGYSFSRLARELEAKTGFHFYFDPAETDSLEINLTADQVKLDKLLDQVFQHTGFHFAIDRQYRNVFITHLVTIQTELPKHYFNGGTDHPDTAAVRDYMPEETVSDNTKISPESKLFEIGARTGSLAGKATMAGYIRDAKTGEPIAGATIRSDTPPVVINTDQFGYYTITLPRGRHQINISSFGMKDTRRQILLLGDGKLNIELVEYVASLKAVIVSAEKTSNTRSVQMGVNKLSIQTIKQVPVVFGETDIIKVVMALPGVTSVGEASNGFNVRGGAADQNLILFNDATIYNPSHLFGFFSAFDPDAVKGVELYKSAIPEKYGGRLSSVLD
ncbi:MAG TPA: carboxypeptidase-like regulatory domain-containing protein, partial [Puia sp.]|nr:carboxypeptidase-like regulatory domain-containing protein [Puia sp.]